MNKQVSATLALAFVASSLGSSEGVFRGAAANPPLATAPALPRALQLTPAPAPSRMLLGSAVHFAQGWNLTALTTAKMIGSVTLRDEIYWDQVEKTPGRYDYSSGRANYVNLVARQGFSPILLFNGGNPNYDGGGTPYTQAGRKAFAAFVVATLKQFPNVEAIEIGNEFNGNDFVFGPVRSSGYGQRQHYYFEVLKAVYDAVKPARPDVMILGGAAHSIPVGYYKTLFADGALGKMDGIVVHPFTTPPEQFAKQIELLRSAMSTHPLPVYATEFSLQCDSATATAGYLIKMTTAMAEAGVAGAQWYALRQEGSAGNIWYKNAALSTFSGDLTVAGRAFRFINQELLTRGDPKRIAINDFTYAFAYGTNAMVLWGAKQALHFTGSASFYNASGEKIASPAAIDPDAPLIIVSDLPIVYGVNLVLGETELLADSFDQFDYTGGSAKLGGPWSYYSFGVAKRRLERLYRQGGGEVSGSNWTPYLGSDSLRPLSLDATVVSPADFGSAGAPNAYKVISRYTSPLASTVNISGYWRVAAGSTDGIDLTVRRGGTTIFSTVVKDAYDLKLDRISLPAGETLDFIVGPNGTAAGGDATEYRIQIFRAKARSGSRG